jgi:predicted lipoprotein with Yx(FWY)xxD motif
VRGQFGTLERPDDRVQITFNGMPLDTYAADSQPGQANGQGIGGVWFAVAS